MVCIRVVRGRPGTLVKVRQEGFAGAPAAAGHAEGWKRVLGWLHGFVEQGETVAARPPLSPPPAGK